MRFFLLFVYFICINQVYAQITILEDKIKESKVEICPYDSMSNLKELKEEDGRYGFRHLKGQTMLYCGDPWNYNYNSPKCPVGDYYLIKDVEIYPGSSLKKYCVFKIENTKTHELYSFNNYLSEFNYSWVVVGYYEKQKSIHVGKEYVYRGDLGLSISDKDGFFNIETDTITKNIKDGTIWKCVDVSVKMRTSKEWKYEMGDKRSPIVLVLDNPEYGKHYCYLEDSFASHFSTKNMFYKDMADGLPLICGKFVEKKAYDKINAINAQEKAKRKAELTKKFGTSNAKLIMEGKIRIGMTKQMCKEAWGEPDYINRTTSVYGSTEQWCYGDTYVYFEGNKITTIQD